MGRGVRKELEVKEIDKVKEIKEWRVGRTERLGGDAAD